MLAGHSCNGFIHRWMVLVYWILAAICLLIAFTVPRLRVAGIIGCVLLGLMLAWGMIQRLRGPGPASSASAPMRGNPVSPGVVLGALPLDSIKATGLQLTGGGAPYKLRGRISNESRDLTVKSVTVLMTRRDCFPAALDPSGCEILWQNQQWIPLTVPPQQEREFASSFWAHGSAPRARGTLDDSFKILAATGEPVR
jgi:hypothetical protein